MSNSRSDKSRNINTCPLVLGFPSLQQWDILSNSGIVQEMAHIANGHDPGNAVSLLRVNVSLTLSRHMQLLGSVTNTELPYSMLVVYFVLLLTCGILSSLLFIYCQERNCCTV